MSCDASGRTDTKERGKIFFMIKKWKLEKLNRKMKELGVKYLKKISISSHIFSFFFASFSNIFVFVFPIKIKMRGVYVDGNEKELEKYRECFLLFFSTSFNDCFFFLKER